jgi:phosphohistidine phosphatase
MPLTLFLLRHAKSGWDNPSLEDFDRPLSDRGHREAQWLRELLQARGISPSRIVCSASQRTRETLAAILPVLTREASIDITRRLYDAPTERLLTVIREQLPTDNAVMLVGHNPGLEDLANMLAGAGDRAAISALRNKYPPAGLAKLDFDLDLWSGVGAGNGRLAGFDVPPRDA